MKAKELLVCTAIAVGMLALSVGIAVLMSVFVERQTAFIILMSFFGLGFCSSLWSMEIKNEKTQMVVFEISMATFVVAMLSCVILGTILPA